MRLLIIIVVIMISFLFGLAGSDPSVPMGGVPLFLALVLLALFIQFLAFIPSYFFQTEKYYDLVGMFTYLILIWLAYFLGSPQNLRSTILATMVTVWSLRLGLFLFARVREQGEDIRFREFKKSGIRFLLVWLMQGMWIIFILGAALASLLSQTSIELGLETYLGMILWIFGFSVESLADHQKRAFKKKPENKGKFISTGLWAWSRHPNYFGEIVLWLGIVMIAFPTLQGFQYVMLISPVFVFLLLTKISGIPILEKLADKRWGSDPEYNLYKKNTPMLFLRPPKKLPESKWNDIEHKENDDAT